MSTIAQLTIFPTDKGTSVSQYVAEAVKIIIQSGLPYKSGPMSTSIEGEWGQIMETVNKCFDTMQQHSDRIYMTLTVDYRKDRQNGLTNKTKSLEKKLGHRLQ